MTGYLALDTSLLCCKLARGHLRPLAAGYHGSSTSTQEHTMGTLTHQAYRIALFSSSHQCGTCCVISFGTCAHLALRLAFTAAFTAAHSVWKLASTMDCHLALSEPALTSVAYIYHGFLLATQITTTAALPVSIPHGAYQRPPCCKRYLLTG
jgi:hypothetical protein